MIRGSCGDDDTQTHRQAGASQMTTSAHSYYLVLGLLGWHKSNHRAWVLFTLLRVVHVLEPQMDKPPLKWRRTL